MVISRHRFAVALALGCERSAARLASQPGGSIGPSLNQLLKSRIKEPVDSYSGDKFLAVGTVGPYIGHKVLTK